jgi:hypothetical protein
MAKAVDSPIHMTVKEFFSAALVVVIVALGGLWAVLSFTMNGISDDVIDIRSDLKELRDISSKISTTGTEKDFDLQAEINNIGVSLQKIQDDISVSNKELSGLRVAIGEEIEKVRTDLRTVISVCPETSRWIT